MSLFPNANNILISGGVFNSARGDLYIHHSGERLGKGQQFMDSPFVINLTHIHRDRD